MPKKPDNFAGLRPSDDDLDQPLVDHRNTPKNNGIPERKKAPNNKNKAKSKPNKPRSRQRPTRKAGQRPGVRIGRRGGKRNGNRGGTSGTQSGKLPQSNLPTNKSETEPLEKQQQRLNNLPKRGEQVNSNKNNNDANTKANAANEHEHHRSNSDSLSDIRRDLDNDDMPKVSDFNHHNDNAKSDQSHNPDEDKNDDKSDNDNAKGKNGKSDTKKDDKSKSETKGDGNRDFDTLGGQEADGDNQESPKDSEVHEPESPVKKVWNFISGKKPTKNKSFSTILQGQDRNAPEKPKGPINNIKDVFDRIRRIFNRLMFLLKLYLTVLKIWLIMKLVAFIQGVLAAIIHFLQWIGSIIASIWSALTGIFASIGIGAGLSAVFSGGIFALVAVAVFTVIGAVSAMVSENNRVSEYDRICRTSNRATATDDDTDDITKGSGSWKKKGTKEYQRAHSVFKSWTNRGLSGAAAAGIVGWVTHEGGDFSILDRAEGHYGNTEKEAGISENNEPIPSGNYSVGGGGIYQFTPYTKFLNLGKKSLGNKKWLSAAAQNKQVANELNQNGWNSKAAYVDDTSFPEFARSTDAAKCVLKWNGYERGATASIAATAASRKADAKAAYKLFNGADYKFDKKKFDAWYKPGTPGGVTDTGGSTPDDRESGIDPRCNMDERHSDDDGPSSNSIVKTAEQELKEGRHPSGTKYCKWFNVNVGTPWCAIFVSWVLHHTKGYEYIPKQGAVSGFASYFKGKNEDRSYKTTPKPGWLILFDWDNQHNTGSQNSHIGIVTKVENGKISTIEGDDFDNGDTILKALPNYYKVGDKSISMYAVPKKK